MRQRWLVAGAMTAMALAGCGASETASENDPPVTGPSGSSGGGCTIDDGASDIESVLAFVPDTEANRQQVQIADLEAFLADQDKVLPEDFREITFVDPVVLFTPTPLLQDAIARADESTDPLADEFGIGLGQVRLGVSAGVAPDVTDVLVGDFDPATVATAVDADPFWSPQKETVEANGQTYYSWGEDNESQPKGRTPLRPLGIGGRLWVGDHVAAYTRSTGVMDAVLAACSGAAPTLADDEAYAGIARHLDGFDGAFDVMLTDHVRTPDEVGGGRTRGSVAGSEADTLEGVTAYGFASGLSDDPERARIRLVLASGSDEEAADNVDAFLDRVANGTSANNARPWSDVLEVEHTDVDGPFVIVDLLAGNATVLRTDLFANDSLIVSS